MNEARTALLARREAVLVRIADERRSLARSMHSLHRPLRYIELAASTWRLLSQRPGLLLGVAFVVAAGSRDKPLRMLRRGLLAWQLVQGLRRVWRARARGSTLRGHAAGGDGSRPTP